MVKFDIFSKKNNPIPSHLFGFGPNIHSKSKWFEWHCIVLKLKLCQLHQRARTKFGLQKIGPIIGFQRTIARENLWSVVGQAVDTQITTSISLTSIDFRLTNFVTSLSKKSSADSWTIPSHVATLLEVDPASESNFLGLNEQGNCKNSFFFCMLSAYTRLKTPSKLRLPKLWE